MPTDINIYDFTLTFEDIPTPQDVESIPRVRTSMKRRAAGAAALSATGDTLLLVGCALDGPSDLVTSLVDIRQASALYGPQTFTADYAPTASASALIGQWSGNTLMKSLSEIRNVQNVRLLRVGGVVARGADLAPGLHVRALYPGAGYNGATITLSADPNGAVFVVVPPRVKGRPFTLRIPVGRTLAQICDIFNADPRNQAFILVVDGASSRLTAQDLSSTTVSSTLMDGQYGTEYDQFPTPADLYGMIVTPNGALDIIRDTPADMLYVAGIYADDDLGTPDHSFVQDLGTLCAEKSEEGTPVLATIGLRPLDDSNQRAISSRVASLTTVSGSYDLDGRVNIAQFLEDGVVDNLGEETGRFVSVFAGPDVTFTGRDLPPYTENPAAWYASLACKLRVPETMTNKDVPNDIVPLWRFTHKQINALNGGIGFGGENAINISATEGGGAYVTLKQRPFGRGWCVVEDVTAASRNSPFAHLYVSRVLQGAEEVVQSVVYPYIGQSNSSATIAALDRQLEQRLDLFADTGALQGHKENGYGYRLWSTVQGYALGVLYLTLWLLPVGEIHRIDTMITVS